ncbi:MAG: MFS transporter [Proteobacteria bacterium]|nr:MFS transporter [Pseudomonadota bacterium]
MTSPRYDRRLVAWLSVGQLISWGSIFYGFGVLLEPVEQSLGLTRAQSSLAFSLALLAEGAMAWPVGRWIDRGHERAVMTGGSLLLVAGLLLHSVASGLWSFYAAWTVLGLGLAGTLYNPAFAVVTRRFPLDFRRAIITLTFLGGLASTVFIPLVAWGVAHAGWRATVLELAAVHLLVCAPLHFHWLRGAPPAALATAEPADSAADPGLRTHLRSAPFLLIGVFVVLLMAVTAALPPHMVSLLRGVGLAESWAIAVPASIGAVQVLGRALLYVFEHRFDLHLANRLIPCLIPIGLAALLAGAGHAWAALLFVAFYGMGNGMLTIVKGTAIAQYVSRAHVATLNGALGLPTAVARAVAPWLLGVLWQPVGGYTAGLWALLTASVVAVVALVLAQRMSLSNS